ncbi:MAG: YifB family Mg chelatase-like AAA ATPase [Alphaproteobacteria bacterium]|nr:YifB family Mg chelatase-like AAA ATPase [Alphaproteobacteria bacterium]
MLARINTITFNGLETLAVDLQIQIASGMPNFTIVGLPDKAIAESRERVRAAIQSLGLSLPAKRITINLSPADLLKEGSHFDLPVALGILCCMGIIPVEELSGYIALGELGLDGSIVSVNGVLPVAIYANRQGKGLICPFNQGSEAAWSGLKDIVAAPDLTSLINHFKGECRLLPPVPKPPVASSKHLDMSDVKGQESAKRALEIAAAGGHNLLMVGPPGSGKSMLAARMPSILPPMSPQEALETSMIHSVAGILKEDGLCLERPFRDPHHNASTPSLVGGGRKAKPGEISLAHNGVLFLDELPEFDRSALEALRQPLENGQISIARVNTHAVYPAKFQLIAAMNPCRCGNLGIPELACPRAPKCALEYQSKISGPLLDRIDIHIEVPAVSPWQLSQERTGETSDTIRKRVIAARQIQKNRFIKHGITNLSTNAELKGQLLEELTQLEDDAKNLLVAFADKNHLSARAYHRTLRLARTIADLQNKPNILKMHIAEALSYRHTVPES